MSDMLKDAGRFIDGYGVMLWERRLAVPVERAWQAISTKEGLDQWWMARSNQIDLRPGGLFRHHWKSTVVAFEEEEFIDFESEPGFGKMRFELRRDGDGAIFSFLDIMKDAHFRPDPKLYAGPCGGWHAMFDALEMHLTGKRFELGAPRDARGRAAAGTYEADLVDFYAAHLERYFERLDLMRSRREAASGA